VRRSAVEVEVVFLHILAVIALAVGQTKQALFQNRVSTVPQGDRETQLLFVIGDTRQTIFSPAVGTRMALVMTKVVPRISILAVVFANRAPLPLAEVGSLLLPRSSLLAGFIQPMLLIAFKGGNERFRARFCVHRFILHLESCVDRSQFLLARRHGAQR
jgi:hypothetical protein